MKKICIVTTMWSSINNWIVPFLYEYNNRNVDVTIVCNMDVTFENNLKNEFPFVHTYSIPFPRGINFIGSIKSILSLLKLFKRCNFNMVQYSTPNASLYAAIASKIAKIPIRLYCQWGMVYVTMSGMKRTIFRQIEKIVCKFSTIIQPDSYGNLIFCREQGFYDESKSCIIWNGSAKGLNVEAFDVTKKPEFSKEIKAKYNISETAPIIGTVGRLGKEKGSNELLKAYKRIKKDYPELKLLFVGPIEKESSIEPELLQFFWNCKDIIKTDRVSNVEKYVSAMDIFVLPSYREGFGMSVIEASSMEVPVVVTEYPGPSNAMKNAITGYSVPIKNDIELEKAIRKLLNDESLRKQLGRNGRMFVVDHFEQKIFTQKYMENRMNLLNISK